MKIAMIGHKTIPSRDGGIEVVLMELVSRMVKAGHRVDCYNRCEDMTKVKELPREYEGANLIWVPTFRKQSLNAFVYSVLATIQASMKDYDVIHIHAEGPAFMTFLPQFMGVPVVVTIHGLDWQRAKWGGFATRFLKLGEKNAALYSDAMVVLSRENQHYFYNNFRRDAVYINNGIEEKTYREPQEIRERWGLERDSYILFLARIVPEKGLHYLLKAFRKVKTDKKLVIAGRLVKGNQYCDEILSLAEQDPRVITTDFVTGRTLEELFSNCSIYCLPSDIEGMAMSFLEALSYGARCLVSNIPENTEVAEDYAQYFTKSNVDSLAAQLEEMLSHEEYDREAQQQYMREHYSWDLVTAQTLRLYDCAIAGRKRTPAARFQNWAKTRREMPILMQDFPQMQNMDGRTRRRCAKLIHTLDRLERMRFRSECEIIRALYSNRPQNELELSWFDRYNMEIRMVRSELGILLHGVQEDGEKV